MDSVKTAHITVEDNTSPVAGVCDFAVVVAVAVVAVFCVLGAARM